MIFLQSYCIPEDWLVNLDQDENTELDDALHELEEQQ